MTSEIINVRSVNDIEDLSNKYGENAMFKSTSGDTDYEMSIPDLMFYADDQDVIDWELFLA